MTSPVLANRRCHVVSGEKLLAAAGGGGALCEALERAFARRELRQPFTVQVSVAPRSIFSAQVTMPDGRTLPPVQMAEMDRPLSIATFDRLGLAIADHITGQQR